MQDIVDTELPIVAAPMAGGATTIDLVAAVADAGGLGFLAAGYKTPQAMLEDIGSVRARGLERFGVNLFLPAPSGMSERVFRAYAETLQDDAGRYGLDLSGAPLREDDDHWREKIDALITDPVPVVSVTFGVPDARDVRALQRVGTRVLVTVTTVAEALAAREVAPDGLVVQGSDAGGHSGTHDPARRIEPVSTEEVVREVVAAAGLPVIAGGGVDGPEKVRAVLAAGAQAVAVGTLLLRTDESGASRVHRDALADPRFAETVITRAFTGRPARALRNAFIEAHEAEAPLGYPVIHHLTREMRQAAARAGDADRVHLWAGTGWRSARTGPVGDAVRDLARLV
ncbi:nitronate monooxygenase [Microbacterium stercoris]|uniref:Propionate 3-nitronate monooxygenase n=1 Tax=Microbacterium stercoris TaxID=2820289 RepID=A0A939QGR2_9MICO|nr:nitronate monooxygenase [Microbacterium stercoris]MBO3662478.1 nitronate monooxygenase [Microbacterium stercoris]MBO3664470.1 nitronate monooxygenase [Microbacterium stercoris]